MKKLLMNMGWLDLAVAAVYFSFFGCCFPNVARAQSANATTDPSEGLSLSLYIYIYIYTYTCVCGSDVLVAGGREEEGITEDIYFLGIPRCSFPGKQLSGFWQLQILIYIKDSFCCLFTK